MNLYFIQIPQEHNGQILSLEKPRAAVEAASALLADVHGRRRAMNLRDTLLKALVYDLVPLPGPPGRYSLQMRYRLSSLHGNKPQVRDVRARGLAGESE